MQPTNKTFTYADGINIVDEENGKTIITDNNIHYDVDEGYYWWFGVDVTYHFPGNGRDVTLAYEGLHGSSSDSIAPAVGGADNFSFNTPGSAVVLVSDFTGVPYNTASAETETRYDAGDLLFGQQLDVGKRIGLHPFVGLRYAHINISDSATYFSPSLKIFDDSPTTENSKLDNEFNGIGPRLGSDAEINLGGGFSVRARLGLSALIGSGRVDTDATLTTPGSATGNPGVFYITDDTDAQTRVIPEIDGRLGLNYTHQFDTMALGLELGWQAENYFNVIGDQYPVVVPLPGTSKGNTALQGNQHYESTANFGMQGPYARVQLDLA